MKKRSKGSGVVRQLMEEQAKNRSLQREVLGLRETLQIERGNTERAARELAQLRGSSKVPALCFTDPTARMIAEVCVRFGVEHLAPWSDEDGVIGLRADET